MLVLTVTDLAASIVAALTTGQTRVVLGGTGDLAGELLERLALGLGDQQRCEDAEEHEQREDLQDVVEPRAGVGGGRAADAEGRDGGLRNDRADLARGGGDTVRGGAVAGGEALAGNDEGGGVGAWEDVLTDVWRIKRW